MYNAFIIELNINTKFIHMKYIIHVYTHVHFLRPNMAIVYVISYRLMTIQTGIYLHAGLKWVGSCACTQ